MFSRLIRQLYVGGPRRMILQTPKAWPAPATLNHFSPQRVGSNNFLPRKCFFCSSFCSPHVEESNESETPEIQLDTIIQLDEAELQTILDSDLTLNQKYKILQLEIDVMRQTGKQVPDIIDPSQWMQLLKLTTRSSRRKYLSYLFKREKSKENSRARKELARLAKKASMAEDTEYNIDQYGLHRTTMFLRIYDTTIHKFYNTKLMQATMFGPKLVIDCGYYAQMTNQESTECAKQLTYLFGDNRVQREPFDLYFCNVNKSSLVMQKFHRNVPNAYEEDFPLNITEASYMDIFDKKDLIYLTPHCNVEMDEYLPDAIYIVGGIVDKTNTQPLSLAKAKKEGLRMAKLPLNKYLLWGPGAGKRLPLNHMVRILADIRATGDWKKALVHVSRRKLEKGLDELTAEKVQEGQDLQRNFRQHSQDKYHRLDTRELSKYSKHTNGKQGTDVISFTYQDRRKRPL